jgi:hypothetical protein
VPIPDRDEGRDSKSAAGLLEYIDRRRLNQVRERRQRTLMRTIVALGLLAAILAVCNVLLLNRLNATHETPAPARVASATLPAPPPPVAPADPPAVSAPEPVPAASLPAPAAAPDAPAPTATPPPAPTTPAATLRAPMPAPPAEEEEEDAALRTARWLVQTHGRIEAEDRVAKVAAFYSGERRAFWARVLLNVRRAPER